VGGDVQETAQSQGDRLAAAEDPLAVPVARIDEPEEKLNDNSKNSSLPPSSE